jgi:hypothetical protein
MRQLRDFFKSLDLRLLALISSFVVNCVILAVMIGVFADNRRLRDTLSITRATLKISDDQIRDALYEIANHRATSEADQTRWFVAGVVAGITEPDNYRDIWHNGYDRGVAVANEAAAAEKAAVLTNGK